MSLPEDKPCVRRQISTWFMASRDPETGDYPDLPPEEAGGSRDIVDPPPPPPPPPQKPSGKAGRDRQRTAETAADSAAGATRPQSGGVAAASALAPPSAAGAQPKPAAKGKKGTSLHCAAAQLARRLGARTSLWVSASSLSGGALPGISARPVYISLQL